MSEQKDNSLVTIFVASGFDVVKNLTKLLLDGAKGIIKKIVDSLVPCGDDNYDLVKEIITCEIHYLYSFPNFQSK